jgi:protein TonB
LVLRVDIDSTLCFDDAMSKRPLSDPRSPVQEGGSSPLVPILLLAALVALLSWGWRQDWTRDAPAEDGTTSLPVAADQATPDIDELAANPPPQRAKANLAVYFTEQDYPASAIRKEEQGSVAFRLAVSRLGRVTECQIVESSGSSTLDATTCRLLRSRARFIPAKDASGNQVPDTSSGRIKWVLPPA